ncbi:TIGR03564 family F420-dependent LLM class oxidoreductase [Actinomadura flavalba]|uniref:TIGR03564 family F420-dependent LLM class oxidoreductase n=1 Tax=Actinomadura flavalba TaxID=1120938 RepID=UPI000476B5EA|nr:TIGR03564 family F420-dependent LLM class oxidoreductase [Actinomadura flavalba]
MTFGVVIAPGNAGNAVESTIEQAKLAKAAGIGSVWFSQQFAYDAIGLAALVGREVPGLGVGTAAVPIFARHPLVVASQAQTAQAATGGRFQLGLGLGVRDVVEPVFGVSHRRPAAHLREFLTALRALEGEAPAYEGESIVAAPQMPVTLPGAPTAPLLVAAMGPRTLAVTGELADGTLPFLAGPRALGEHIVPPLTRAAQAAGRPAPRVVVNVPAVVTGDVDAARKAAAQGFGFFDEIPSYRRVIELEGADSAADLVVAGDEDVLRAAARSYFDAGATEIVFTATDLLGSAGRDRTWRAIAALDAP